VTEFELALLFHLVGAIGFFSGMALAAAAHAAAWRRERAGDVAALLGLACVRVGAQELIRRRRARPA
jgi:hypothetical protein